MAAKAYITPDHPEGIVQRDLRNAAPELQRRTALLWFAANLEPIPQPGARYFSFDDDLVEGQTLDRSDLHRPFGGAPMGAQPVGAGFDEGSWAPANGTAQSFLDAEFEGFIPPAVLTEVATALGGRWTWVAAPKPSAPEPVAPDLGGSPLAQTLDQLSSALAIETAPHGGYGHNSRSSPFTPDQLQLVVDSVLATQEQIATRAPIAEVQQALGPAAAAQAQLAGWLKGVGVATGFVGAAVVTGAAEEGGKQLYEQVRAVVPWLTIYHLLMLALHLAGIP